MKSRRFRFQLVPSTPRTDGTESSLWLTPNVPNGGRVNPPEAVARLLPTPRRSVQDMGTMEMSRFSGTERKAGKPEAHYDPANGGQLNPTWVEWLMGFPLGWTDLEV
jgi:DNA (cytosine-5)-methyltransferase 1